MMQRNGSTPANAMMPPLSRGLIGRVAVISLALALAGSAGMAQLERTRESEAAGNIQPRDPTGDIVALMRNYLNNPEGVRGAFVSEPQVLEVATGRRRYASCLRYDARNSSGRYAGSKDSLVIFWNGRLDRITSVPDDLCKNAQYRPFPELERMTR